MINYIALYTCGCWFSHAGRSPRRYVPQAKVAIVVVREYRFKNLFFLPESFSRSVFHRLPPLQATDLYEQFHFPSRELSADSMRKSYFIHQADKYSSSWKNNSIPATGTVVKSNFLWTKFRNEVPNICICKLSWNKTHSPLSTSHCWVTSFGHIFLSFWSRIPRHLDLQCLYINHQLLCTDYTSQQDFGTRNVYCVSNVTFHAESKYAIKNFPSLTVFVQWPF